MAVAHTSDDQAETILHRIVRGTGLRGLAGMPQQQILSSGPERQPGAPLLDVSRGELGTTWLLAQPFREDQSNADIARTRARIRHDLLPKLAAEYNPRVAQALVRLGALAGAMQRSLESTLDELERSR